MSTRWPRCDVDGCSSPAEFEVTLDGKAELRCAMGIRSLSGTKRRLAITDFPWYQPEVERATARGLRASVSAGTR